MVIVERFPENMGNIVLGQGMGTSIVTAIALFVLYFVALRLILSFEI